MIKQPSRLSIQLRRLVVFRDKDHIPFSFKGFIASYTIQSLLYMIVVLGACYFISFPTLSIQMSNFFTPAYFGWLVGGHAFMSLFEWFYHRYVLHRIVWKPLGAQRDEHTHHHERTDVSYHENKLEIKDPEQTESATFPFYALLAFWGVFSLLIVTLQVLFSKSPVLIGCFSSITLSLVLYEIYHAAMHMNFDKYWKKWINHFPFLLGTYVFHLAHHNNKLVNQAIGGFFLFAIWDRLFGTYYTPLELLVCIGKGENIPKILPSRPTPRRWVLYLDEKSKDAHKRISEKEENKKAS